MKINFIILSFPQFAGGKFISNCLSLSKLVCPQDSNVAKYLLNNPADYDYRLAAVLGTLPRDRRGMRDWIAKFEFGDLQLYGPTVSIWQSGMNKSPTNLVTDLLTAGFRLFITAHGGDVSVRNILTVWPNSLILQLINHVKFSEISKNLKSDNNKTLRDYAGNYCNEKYSELAGKDWPSWREFDSVGYDIQQLPNYASVREEILEFYNWKGINNKTVLFNIDESIFNQTKFLIAMEKLYKQLGLPDYNPELVGIFWRSYINLHVDTTQIL